MYVVLEGFHTTTITTTLGFRVRQTSSLTSQGFGL